MAFVLHLLNPKRYSVHVTYSETCLQLWNSLPEETKHAKSLAVFRQKVKSMTFDQCPCNLCREYVHGVGYID